MPSSWSSVSRSSVEMCSSSLASPSAIWSAGALAFHRSQIGGNASGPAGSPSPIAARSISSEISAPLPRWDRTCATDQSRQYDWSVARSGPSAATAPARLPWEARSTEIQ